MHQNPCLGTLQLPYALECIFNFAMFHGDCLADTNALLLLAKKAPHPRIMRKFLLDCASFAINEPTVASAGFQ